MKKQRFASILKKFWMATIAALSLAFMAIFSITLTLSSYFVQKRHSHAIATHIASTLEPKIRVRDEYEILRYLNKLTADGKLLAVSIRDHSGLDLISYSNKIPPELMEQFDKKFSGSDLLSPYHISQTNVEVFKDQLVSVRIGLENKDTAAILKKGLIGAFIFVLFSFLATYYFSKYAIRKITLPLSRLVDIISSGRSLKDHDIVVESCAETSEAFAKYTEQSKSLEKQITASAKFEGMLQVAQMAVHDIKRPLALLKLVLREFEKENSEEKSHELLTMLNEDYRLKSNNNDILLKEVFNSNSKYEYEIKIEDLTEIIEPVCENFKKHSQRKYLSWSYGFSHTSLIKVDRKKILRVFENILSNALDAVPEHGHIWIHTKDREGCIDLHIGNSGSYIPDEEKGSIFTPFYTKGKQDGTGLGLTICQKIIEDHGGKIFCTSDKKRGTEFVLTLPKADQNKLNISEFESDSVKSTKINVALIDDDQIVRLHWQSMLKGMLTLHTFSSYEDFFSQKKSMYFDYIFTDFYLKEKTADRYIKKLRKKHKCPIILCSNAASINGNMLFDGMIGKQPPSFSKLRQFQVRAS